MMTADAGKDERKQETNPFIFTEEESEGPSRNGVVRSHTELVVNTKSAPRVGIALCLCICHSNCFAPGLWMDRVYSLNNRRQAWSVSSTATQSSIGLTLISSCSGVTCLQPEEAASRTVPATVTVRMEVSRLLSRSSKRPTSLVSINYRKGCEQTEQEGLSAAFLWTNYVISEAGFQPTVSMVKWDRLLCPNGHNQHIFTLKK